MPLLINAIKVGGTYTLVKCADAGIKCINESSEVTITRVSQGGCVCSTDVTYNGELCNDATGWAIASEGTLSEGRAVLEAVKE